MVDRSDMADLFDGYACGDGDGDCAWDEMFEGPGRVRPPYRSLHDALRTVSYSQFEGRCAVRDRAFRDRGITFSLSGEERPFPLDLVPRIISAGEWATLEAGVLQRVKALEAFLADVYGPAHILADRVVPRRLVTSSAHFHRAAHGLEPSNGVRIHVAGIDIVRGADGRFRVLEDNIRVPSGVSYLIENRYMMTRVFPELLRSHPVRPVGGYPANLLEGLRAAAPASARRPTVVVLTPGEYNSAYFEHSFLARQMGVELVEGRDLTCREDVVYMRTTGGERRVDVVYRRVDDEFLDPLHFRSDSVVGCPGILNAARAGNVTLANAVGNGVADDKLAYTYVPDMIAYYLGESPILPNVETYRLEDPDQRAHVIAHLDKLVLKPVAGSGGYGIVMGPHASDEELQQARSAVEAQPRQWIAQEMVNLSTAPTAGGGRLAPRHLDLRPFAVNDGNGIWVVPGGLTRVALPAGGLMVNSSQGGGSKDTWVLSDGAPPSIDSRSAGVDTRISDSPASRRLGQPAAGPALAAHAADQEQQQQQSRPTVAAC
jgi:uncharacterized circularly permuted ATP-grasp superfamily protein